MAKLRDEADKTAAQINRQMAMKLRENRIVVNLLRRRMEKALTERRKLIGMAYKTMTIEEIGQCIGLSKQRISRILGDRQQEGRKDNVQDSGD